MKSSTKRLTAGLAVVSIALLGAESAMASGISVFPNKSVIWQIINFLVLIWAMNMILYRPIRNIIARRKEQVNGLDSHIGRSRQDAADKENALIEGVRTARDDGAGKKNALVESAEAEEKGIIQEIHKSTQQTITENKARIAREAEKAAAELEKQVDVFAVEIGQKILGRKVA